MAIQKSAGASIHPCLTPDAVGTGWIASCHNGPFTLLLSLLFILSPRKIPAGHNVLDVVFLVQAATTTICLGLFLQQLHSDVNANTRHDTRQVNYHLTMM